MQLQLNSVGCPTCRAKHRQLLQDFLRPHLAELCKTCQDRFERNPLRIMDCKSSVCQELTKDAPTIFDNLCPECAEHFAQVEAALTTAGIPYTINKRLVRGLDYYTKTAFEIVVEAIGAQSAICGGGRYDGLLAEIGEQNIPGVGFALGMERIFGALKAQGDDIAVADNPDVFIVTAPGSTRVAEAAFALLSDLRRARLKAEMDLAGKSIKAQFKLADKLAAPFVVVVGEDELAQGQAQLRDMKNSEQQLLPLSEIVNKLKAVHES